MKLLRSLILFAFAVQLSAMTTSGNQILDSNGNSIQLKGINWFGFNGSDDMVDGLWAGPDDLSLDFSTIVYRLQLLGFNAVRLPFSFPILFGTEAPRTYNQPASQATVSQIQASVTDPKVPPPSGSTIPPQNSPPTVPNPSVSNSYLPNDTTLNRFLWVVNFFAKNGFYVLIDNHLREDQTVLQQGQAAWVQDWVKLVTAISKDSVSSQKLMIDLLNEPDNFGIRWEASGSTPALKDLYLAAMDALYPINPKALFFIEGTGQGGIGANWGDGFCTDPTLIQQNGLSNPTSFFTTLLQKPYLNQVVISPHVYPPSVTGASTNYSGTGLWNRLTESFGYLTQTGFTSGSKTKIFPVAVGEFGSRFTEAKDLVSMPDIASYLNNSAGAADGKHKAIGNWFYWSWNANSGDTGGVVSDDWRTILWNKVEYLETIALKPWFLSNPPPVDTGTLCISIAPTTDLTASALKPINAGNYTFTINSFNTPVCQKVNVGTYTITAPEIIIGNKKFDAPNQSVSVAKNLTTNATVTYKETIVTSSAVVTVQAGTPWPSGSMYQNVINLFITNTGSTTISTPWQLTLTNSGYQSVNSSWNCNINSLQSGTISVTVPNSWEVLQPNSGNTINIGFIITSNSQNFQPTQITVNGSTAIIK